MEYRVFAMGGVYINTDGSFECSYDAGYQGKFAILLLLSSVPESAVNLCFVSGLFFQDF